MMIMVRCDCYAVRVTQDTLEQQEIGYTILKMMKRYVQDAEKQRIYPSLAQIVAEDIKVKRLIVSSALINMCMSG